MESSKDSLYDAMSQDIEFKLELDYARTTRLVDSVDHGQVTVRKCLYSIGFEDVPQDLSADIEGLAEDSDDEGYSNRAIRDVEAGNDRALRDRNDLAFRGELQLVDLIDDEGLVSAIGKMEGVEASRGVESLLGYTSSQPENDTVVRLGDEPSVVVSFNAEQRRMAALVADLQDRYENENIGELEEAIYEEYREAVARDLTSSMEAIKDNDLTEGLAAEEDELLDSSN